MKPEDCAVKIYKIIKEFKGSKEELQKHLEEQFLNDMKNVKLTPKIEENAKKVVDLVKKKLTKDDKVTVEEFQAWEEAMFAKWKAAQS
jgi:hypothetical protein